MRLSAPAAAGNGKDLHAGADCGKKERPPHPGLRGRPKFLDAAGRTSVYWRRAAARGQAQFLEPGAQE
jgi:hypothetical protein